MIRPGRGGGAGADRGSGSRCGGGRGGRGKTVGGCGRSFCSRDAHRRRCGASDHPRLGGPLRRGVGGDSRDGPRRPDPAGGCAGGEGPGWKRGSRGYAPLPQPRRSPAPRTQAAAPSRNQAAVARVVSQSHREKPVFHVTMTADMSRVIEARKGAKAGLHQLRRVSGEGRGARHRFVPRLPTVSERREASVSRRGGRCGCHLRRGRSLCTRRSRPRRPRASDRSPVDIDALAAKARARTIGTAESDGSCFLVSNLGMFPVESFDAIVYPDHAAALAVGAAIPTPVSDGTRDLDRAPGAPHPHRWTIG